MKPIILVLVVCLALALGGCSSGGGSAVSDSGATPGPTMSVSPSMVAELTRDDLLDPDGNVTLYIANESGAQRRADIALEVDGIPIVDRYFVDDGLSYPKPIMLRLSPGTHELTARSTEGKASLTKSFVVEGRRWLAVSYRYSTKAQGTPEPRQLVFRMQSEPMLFD